MDTKRTNGDHPVHSVAYVERARDWAVTLEDRERARSGSKLPDARRAVAERIAVPAGTLRNLRLNRVKGIAVHWYERLRAAVVHDLQAEMRRLQHELDIHRQTGSHPASNEVAAVVADIEAVRLALGLGSSNSGGGHD